MHSSRNAKHLLLHLGSSSLIVFGLAIALTPTAPAQPKKPEKKADKAEPIAKEPKVVDVLVGGGGVAEQVAYINEMLAKSWKENKIVPADRCTDYEFIRRASLDIIGRIAKIDEIYRFLKDSPERRRSMLIERLLDSPEYGHNWANMWTVLLMTRTASPAMYQDQMREWLEDKLTDKKQIIDNEGRVQRPSYSPDWSKIATDLLAAQGRTKKIDITKTGTKTASSIAQQGNSKEMDDANTNAAVNFVLAHLGEEIKQDRAASGKYDMVPLTSRTTRLFLGLRTQCVQCHDHPFSGDWLQSHFWGINAFFRQVDPDGRPSMMVKKKDPVKDHFEVRDNPSLNVKGIVPYERRSGVLLYTDATFLDGKKMPAIKDPSKSTRRAELAKFITNSPYFAKAYVNRMWGHFFGRSFTKDAVDDFGDHNPVSHPELFERLSEDWAKKYRHDPKALIRWICNSRAYGLSSTANATNDKPEDEAFFARMLLKPMTPEQLFDSLMTATEAKVGRTKESKKDLKAAWLRKLVVNFGDDEGNEGTFNGTVVQALLLMNGKDINEAIMDKDMGTAAIVLKQYPPSNATTARKAMDVLFKAALNRPPTAKEMSKIMDPKTFNFRTPAPQDQVAFWTGYYQDVFWALLNSNEFILNH